MSADKEDRMGTVMAPSGAFVCELCPAAADRRGRPFDKGRLAGHYVDGHRLAHADAVQRAARAAVAARAAAPRKSVFLPPLPVVDDAASPNGLKRRLTEGGREKRRAAMNRPEVREKLRAAMKDPAKLRQRAERLLARANELAGVGAS